MTNEYNETMKLVKETFENLQKENDSLRVELIKHETEKQFLESFINKKGFLKEYENYKLELTKGGKNEWIN